MKPIKRLPFPVLVLLALTSALLIQHVFSAGVAVGGGNGGGTNVAVTIASPVSGLIQTNSANNFKIFGVAVTNGLSYGQTLKTSSGTTVVVADDGELWDVSENTSLSAFNRTLESSVGTVLNWELQKLFGNWTNSGNFTVISNLTVGGTTTFSNFNTTVIQLTSEEIVTNAFSGTVLPMTYGGITNMSAAITITGVSGTSTTNETSGRLRLVGHASNSYTLTVPSAFHAYPDGVKTWTVTNARNAVLYYWVTPGIETGCIYGLGY